MRIVTAAEMQQIDKLASERFAIPAVVLMEDAALASVRQALKMLAPQQTNVVIFCGPGNNGGDGFACARHLLNRGLSLKIYFCGKKAKLSPAAKINYRILQRLKAEIIDITANPRKKIESFLEKDLNKADLVIDALLGIGLKGAVREPFSDVIRMINASDKTVLSLDIPSGLDATTGKSRGIAVRAEHTVTFALFKQGFLEPEAKQYTGEISIADIGLPRQLLL